MRVREEETEIAERMEKGREMKKCTEDGYSCANLLTQRCTWRQLAMQANLLRL